MAKYKYKRDVFKGLTPFPFLGEVKTRVKKIEEAEATVPQSVFNANILAKSLHPSVQFVKIAEVIDEVDAKTFVFVPDKEKGTEKLAFFRAGQYVSVALDIGDAKLCKPYTLSSAPKTALDGKYAITVKKTANGYASDYILENWAVGSAVVMSAPLGEFYYSRLRDAKNVLAVAGGSGITPFLSMAEAIADGTEDFNLTILYGSRNENSILLKDELDVAAERAEGKVKIVNVLSESDAEGFEHGFINGELIKKYAPDDDYSIFACGPKAMYEFLKKEIAQLSLPKRRVRFELSGEFGNPANDPAYDKDNLGKSFKVSVLVRGEVFETECKSEQTLLNAIETAGIRAPSDCKSGQCGWCHSRLISGEVFVPESADGRRIADKKFGWVHPCVTYPLSDIEIEVFPIAE
ncbi:MAG: 2Fe-2S iron-sulfur cluster-binding protein [Clostridia bacterium]|nr:2Fe-2S iron-sulfur cluster-binding protein [Clostridia bacterium]